MSIHRGGQGREDAARAIRSGALGRATLAATLAAGVAACSASPEYPISLGERPGSGGIMTQEPRYPVSAQDAAQNAADVRAGRAYPAYGAPAYSAPGASPPAPPAATPAPADDQADDAPHGLQSAPVESAELPPAGAASPDSQPMAAPPPPPPPSDDAAPRARTISFGGGQIVFGTDSLAAPALEFAAYRRHRRHAVAQSDSADGGATSDAKPARKGRRHHGEAAEKTADRASDASSDTSSDTGKAPAADTPYQTVVRPGEKLSEVAERVHTSKAALVELNDLKHPKHVHAGTVLKIPYKYSYEVQKGDTLYTISHRFGQDPSSIAKLNGLKTVPTLQPGESLALPPDAHDEGKRDHAAAASLSPQAAPTRLADAALKKSERRSRRHRGGQVKTAAVALADDAQTAAAEPAPGRRHRGDEASPAPSAVAQAAPAASGPPSVSETAPPLPPPSATAQTAAAQPSRPPPTRSYVQAAASPPPATSTATGNPAAYAGVRPYGATPTTVAPSAAGPTPSTYAAPGYAARQPAPATGQVASLTPPRYSPAYPAGGYAPSLGRERPAAATPAVGAASAGQIASAGKGRFIWPLRGQVISGFGAKGTGEYNNGMDIAVQPGTGVRAAAGGEVAYAGSSIPGYGNMVLIKHPGGWVTAYAHLDRIEVRMHDSVSQGDEIGQTGQTGVASRPELYFEVRFASGADKPRPVDPVLVLPAG